MPPSHEGQDHQKNNEDLLYIVMDIVITYVDGNDPVWKQDYEKYTNVPVMQKRFRDWGTLKYLLRGIQSKMPFIKKVKVINRF